MAEESQTCLENASGPGTRKGVQRVLGTVPEVSRKPPESVGRVSRAAKDPEKLHQSLRNSREVVENLQSVGRVSRIVPKFFGDFSRSPPRRLATH